LAPDFDRDVHCVLGLPFDAVDTAQAVEKVRHAAATGTRCFLTTPNLNFAIAAQADPNFRDSVLCSDLSVADGMPLIWVARLMGVPLPERVAGSTMFERLRHAAARPIKVFFFGGPDGVAERAGGRLNSEGGGAVCVGHESPGFGSVEDMSAAPYIDRINASGADFVVVSLGALKGQAWIQRNLGRLHPPVVSHLGAVVNFVAGTVKRAPVWMGRIGLEWLWRIIEEPTLWRRYLRDGRAFSALLLTRVLPGAVHGWWHRRSWTSHDAQLELTTDERTMRLTLAGGWSAESLGRLRPVLRDAAVAAQSLELDLADLRHVDASVIGLLSLLWIHVLRQGRSWRCTGVHPGARRCLKFACAQYLISDSSQP
jgi:N-acetylglucosaminyldiphosphoundecaprenol N-acetyl-beta-D-mannosaminyltransferase